jgi:chromosome segregation ATPase
MDSASIRESKARKQKLEDDLKIVERLCDAVDECLSAKWFLENEIDRYSTTGSKLVRDMIDATESEDLDDQLATFNAVYEQLQQELKKIEDQISWLAPTPNQIPIFETAGD